MRPKAVYELQLKHYQQHFGINVWAGIVCDGLAGRHVLPHRLTSSHSRDLLLRDLPKDTESGTTGSHRANVVHA
jgi:hypothetical protein